VKKHLVFLFVFAIVGNLLGVLAVLRGYASVQIAGSAVMAAFALILTLFLWWSRKRKQEEQSKNGKTNNNAPLWLLGSFAASAYVAIIQAIHEGWGIGDTIGLAFFLLFAGLSIYEAVRRRRSRDAK